MNPSEEEALEIIVEMCHNLIVVFAEEYNVNQANLNIRIDLENLYANPIFGIFEKNRPLRKTDAKGLLQSSDIEPGYILVVAEHVKTFIREIFKSRLEFHGINDCKEVYLILSLIEYNGAPTPTVRVVRNNEVIETAPIVKIVG